MNSKAEMQVRTEGTKVVVSVKTPPPPQRAKDKTVIVTTSDVYQELLSRGFDVEPQHVEGSTLNSETSQRGTWVYTLKTKPKVPTKAQTTTQEVDTPATTTTTTTTRRKKKARPSTKNTTTQTRER